MARYNKINDLYFTESGDYALDDTGDIADTRNESYRGFIQAVHTIMVSSKGDWKQQRIGANITSFLGKPNNSDLARRVVDSISTELFKEDLVRPTEVKIEVLPISSTQIIIALIFSPPGVNKRFALTYTYDTRDNKVMLRNV